MRRGVAFVLMISLLLLSACSGSRQQEDAFKNARQQWQTARQLDFVLELRADLGGNVFSCTMEGCQRPEELKLCFLEPEMVKGICLRKGAEDTLLSYEGLEFSVGKLFGTELSPAQALPLLLEALLQGHVMSLSEEPWEEGSLLCAQIFIDDDLYAFFRLDGNDLSPREGELVCAGRSVAVCTFRSFTTEQGVSDYETPDHEDLG